MNRWYGVVVVVILLCFSTGFASVGPELEAVTDVDDTIKISDVLDSIDRIGYSTFADSLFFGMNSVYQAVKAHYEKEHGPKTSRFNYVSNGLSFTVEGVHEQLISDFGFPDPQNYFARTLPEIIGHKAHKFNVIMGRLRKIDPKMVLLIGDNGESDPETYKKVAAEIEKIAKERGKEIKVLTYIHMVYKPKTKKTLGLHPGQKPFYNAADLAILLHKEGLIDQNQRGNIIREVTAKVKNEGKGSVYGPLVYPSFKVRNMGFLSLPKPECGGFY